MTGKTLKRIAAALTAVLVMLCLGACGKEEAKSGADVIVAATYPVYVFTSRVCAGTENVQVELLVDQSISCLHDYSLSTSDMKKIDRASALVISGAGLEIFLDDITASYESLPVIDSSEDVTLRESEGENDPHIWMSPENAAMQVRNIARGLGELYPDRAELFEENAEAYADMLMKLDAELAEKLSGLENRELITFHDGFGYFAEAYGLDILAAIEEESGSEASAKDISRVISLVDEYSLPAIFTETNGSSSTAEAIGRETGVKVGTLSMIMSGSREIGESDGYMDAMEENVRALLEALGN